MIQITPHMRILVAVEPVDFRAGIDALMAVCRKRLQADPFSGALLGKRRSARQRPSVFTLQPNSQQFKRAHRKDTPTTWRSLTRPVDAPIRSTSWVGATRNPLGRGERSLP